ncbi:MAG: hypothetical protein PHS14_04815 [Elusimicrobia bacterium]|nr:hypothetical protein [Elusimicrobiota bacterium]
MDEDLRVKLMGPALQAAAAILIDRAESGSGHDFDSDEVAEIAIEIVDSAVKRLKTKGPRRKKPGA